MKTIFNFYKKLFGHYDKYALSGAYRVVRKQADGSYVTASKKAQVIGNVYVQALLMGILYMGYLIGRDKGKMEGFNTALSLQDEADEPGFTPAP